MFDPAKMKTSHQETRSQSAALQKTLCEVLAKFPIHLTVPAICKLLFDTEHVPNYSADPHRSTFPRCLFVCFVVLVSWYLLEGHWRGL